MTLVDLVTTIILVIILLALAVAMVTYATRRAQRTRRVELEPSDEQGSWYFVRYSPGARSDRQP
jgi:hypothetical protein